MKSKLPINEEFSEILYNFTKSILFYKPKDILDFSIKYFYCLENKIPLSSNLEAQINTQLSVKTEQNKTKKETNHSDNKQHNDDIIIDNNNIINDNENEITKTNNNSVDESKSENNDLEESDIKVPIGKDIEELIKREEQEEKNKKYSREIERPISGFSGISATDSQKQGVKDFIADLFFESKELAKEQLKKNLEKK